MGKSTVEAPEADENIGIAQREMSALAKDMHQEVDAWRI